MLKRVSLVFAILGIIAACDLQVDSPDQEDTEQTEIKNIQTAHDTTSADVEDPVISDFVGINPSGNTWTFSGDVSDDMPMTSMMPS